MSSDEARQLRNRQQELSEDIGRSQGLEDGGAFILCVTTKIDTYPTAPGVYYAVAPIALIGPVGEGVTVAWTVTGKPFLAAHLGDTAPPINTPVRVYEVPKSFVFLYSG